MPKADNFGMGGRESLALRILYEDNHIIAINKRSSEIVQSDASGDPSLAEAVKGFIKARDNKPGNVFLEIPHRLDRPTSGVVLFAKTDKALGRLGKLFKERGMRKVYWAVVDAMPPSEKGRLEHYLLRDRKKNKSFAYEKERKGSLYAALSYRLIAATDNYYLLEVELETGRHHQIRAQFAAVGCCIKGDLKYGARRSNPEAGIHLHAREMSFVHPVRKEEIRILADPPADVLWEQFVENVE